MKPADRSLRLTVIAIVTALAGLVVVQVLLLMDAFELKQQTFRQSVSAALTSASLRLVAGEALTLAFRMDAEGETGEERGAPQRLRLNVVTTQGLDTVMVDTLAPAGGHAFTMVQRSGSDGGAVSRFDADSAETMLRIDGGAPPPVMMRTGSDSVKQVFVSRVIENLWVSARRPLGERITPGGLDSVLRRSLEDAGIALPYSYGVLDARDSLHLAQPVSAAEDLRSSPYRASFFFEAGPRNRLVVHFPGQQAYLLQQLWPVLLASVVFLGALIAGFGAGLRVIVRQHQLARSMVDFINNMTHEFKTPLSTVTLATEAIRRPDVVGKKSKVMQYNGMIAEETHRMKSQVDRILNLAHLEEGDANLQTSEVDIHALLADAARAFAVQVEARGGRINLNLQASRSVLRGDAVHLMNIVHSLLDNANKYSPDSPEVLLESMDAPGAVVIRVSDRGTGIPAEHQEKVFEKYYRVPTGNLHAVRGFGIGLSYVKRIVELHGGSVRLQSRPGAGTTVIVSLPLNPSPQVSP